MRNAETGQEVVCYSGRYWFDEGVPQLRIAEQCMRACARYGFERVTDHPYVPKKYPPLAPDEDVKPFIPDACLP